MQTITGKKPFKQLFLISVLLACAISDSSFAQSGSLDNTFGTGGKLKTPIGSFGDQGNAIAIQNDNKIVVGGYTQSSFTASDFAVIRYKDNGDPDSTFGINGKVITPVELRSKGKAIALQNDGKILLAGASDWYLNLVRYNPDGSLDMSFGTGGKVTTDVEGYYSERCESVIIQNDGKILVGGYAQHNSNDGSYFLLMRYNNDGSVDSTFATDGKVIGSAGQAFSMAVQADGKIILGGRMNFSFAMERYTADGIPDPSFGTNGTVITPIGNGSEGHSVIVQNDGKILLTGSASMSFNTSVFALARYTSNGTPDNTFGQGGIVTTPVGTYSQGNAARIQNDGKILLAGSAKDNTDHTSFAVARYTVNGNLDNTFGTGGKTITAFGSSTSIANALAIQENGRIVLAGHVYDTNNVDIALARYLDDASTGIDQLSFSTSASTIYPNPVSDAFTVLLEKSLKNGELKIFTPQGQVVRHIKTLSGQEIHVLRNELPAGIYYLRISENNVLIALDKVVINN